MSNGGSDSKHQPAQFSKARKYVVHGVHGLEFVYMNVINFSTPLRGSALIYFFSRIHFYFHFVSTNFRFLFIAGTNIDKTTRERKRAREPMNFNFTVPRFDYIFSDPSHKTEIYAFSHLFFSNQNT